MQVKLIQTQRVLSPTQIPLADYTINPYRGCGFGCLYCYARENKNIKNKGFKNIGVKINSPQILKQELKSKTPKRVLLGSTTECFQYQEKKYKITEKILNILNENNISYTILTKSHLIEDYLHLIEKNKNNKIYFTLNFPSNRIIKIFEPNSSNTEKRLKAINEIIKKKITLRIHAGPFMPYISNLDEIIKILPKKIKELDIEMYHKKQGNFTEILKKIEFYLGRDTKEKLESVYKNKGTYSEFIEKLEGKIKALDNLKKIKTFLIVPDFNEFYNSRIYYETPVSQPGLD